MDLEEMKKSWRTLETRVNRLEDENIRLSLQLKRTHADELRRRLQRNCIGLAVVGLVAPFILILLKDEVSLSTRFVWVYSLFCWLLAAGDLYLYWNLRGIDINGMPVRTAFEAATRFGVLRQRFWLASMIALVPMLAFIIYEFSLIDVSMAVAGAVGGVIGLIIGLRKDRQIREMIREFRQTLDSDADDTGRSE